MSQKEHDAPDFKSKGSSPDEEMLRSALGPLLSVFEEALELSASNAQEWKFYGPKYGWHFKVSRKGKALFYMIPDQGTLRFGMAIRPAEKTAILRSKVPEQVKRQLRGAKKVMEGFPLRFEVKTVRSFDPVRSVIRELLLLRS